jgi:two-component sensor histidine kinase
LSWEETGGPLVRKPQSRGFGTKSLITSIESQLGGQTLFDWRSEGLICRLSVPLTQKAGTPESSNQEMLPGNSSERLSKSASV